MCYSKEIIKAYQKSVCCAQKIMYDFTQSRLQRIALLKEVENCSGNEAEFYRDYHNTPIHLTGLLVLVV